MEYTNMLEPVAPQHNPHSASVDSINTSGGEPLYPPDPQRYTPIRPRNALTQYSKRERTFSEKLLYGVKKTGSVIAVIFLGLGFLAWFSLNFATAGIPTWGAMAIADKLKKSRAEIKNFRIQRGELPLYIVFQNSNGSNKIAQTTNDKYIPRRGEIEGVHYKIVVAPQDLGTKEQKIQEWITAQEALPDSKRYKPTAPILTTSRIERIFHRIFN